MRIVMFSDSYWPRINGVTVSVTVLSRQLIKSGHQVLVVCAEFPSIALENEQQQGEIRDEFAPQLFRVHSHHVIISKEDRNAKVSEYPRLQKAVDLFNPDIVHIHTEFTIGTFGMMYAKTKKKPMVYTFHTYWEDYVKEYVPFVPAFMTRWFIRSVQKEYCRNSSRIIAPSSNIDAVIRRYGIKSRIVRIPTGIDPDDFSIDPARLEKEKNDFLARYPAAQGKKILLFTGRVSYEKNVFFLLDMLKEVRKTNPDTVLCIVGNGPALDDLLQTAKEKKIADSVISTGYVPRKQLCYLYNIADVFVFPSKTETQGLVTIEAMVCGLPVVAIGIMGTADVMNGDNGGFMVSDSLEEFTGRVVQLLDDPGLYAEKKASARSYAKKWTVQVMTENMLTVYTDAVSIYQKYLTHSANIFRRCVYRLVAGKK